MGILIVLGIGILLSLFSLGFKVWRVKQFQKATGIGFLKAWFVLGK